MLSDDMSSIVEVTRLFQLQKIILLVVALVILVFLVKIIQKFGQRLQAHFPGYRLQILQLITILTFFLYLVGGGGLFYFILSPPKELMLAVGASVAVAIGFSLKDLVGSFMAGIVLLFDRPFTVGDRVSFNGIYGEIKTIGLRTVRLQTLDDNLVTIPNARFFSDIVSSGNAGELDMMVVEDFYIALDADIDLARELLYELVVTSRFVFLKKPVKIVAIETAIAERLAIKLTVKAYVFDVKYEKDFQTDIVTRAAREFTENKIKRPQLSVQS